MQQNFIFISACLFTFTIVFFHHLTSSVNGEIPPPQHYLGDVAINCGCLSNSTALDGRRWIGETPCLQPKGKSRSTTSAENLLTGDPTPFLTARISSTYFSYSFRVKPCQKFVRLHFCPSPYLGFQNSQDLFTVKANSFTLLRNFSASLAADALGVKYFVKEFCLTVNDTGYLQITFFAFQRISKMSKFHAFVNGIEIISMPAGLYYTPNGNLGVPVVGRTNSFYHVDDTAALELIQRLNVGGGSILPVEDTGMFRSWSEDSDRLSESFGFQEIDYVMSAFEFKPTFIAPLKIHQTSRIYRESLRSKDKHDFTWKIPVDLGFCYLLRLHLCYCRGEGAQGIPEDFNILIQNVVTETQVNVITLSGDNEIPVYRDYLVMMKGDKTEGKRDIFVSLQSVDELVIGFLKGLEIFKLSNPDNSLASPNPSSSEHVVCRWPLKVSNFLVAFGHINEIMTALTILLALVNVLFYKLSRICENEFVQDKQVQLASDGPSSHHFSLAEILLATRNFDEALVIGKGGFGKVYKGVVYGRPEVLAIKRLKDDSKQGAREFWKEIETLSKLRHIHLVPLIGYCNENEEMILVYEYMPRGTVADNIYKSQINGTDGILLNWEQRLRICIGAARGLDYLHTGTQYGVIHRDVKDTNILLDENYMAKISDFGLSKQGSIDKTQGQVSTRVWGTVGYVDPHYIATHKPSVSSDVYAFGIVLLVVLSGRPAVEKKLFSENSSVLACFQECMEQGEMKEIIDPSIQEEISIESLTKFIEVVVTCVHHRPKKRPTMAQVVVFLEHALEKHHVLVPSTVIDETVVGQPCSDGSKQPFDIFGFQFTPKPDEGSMSKEDGSNQPFEISESPLAPIPEKKFVTFLMEGSTSKENQKPSWGRPLFTLKNILRPTKKKDLASRRVNIVDSPKGMKPSNQNRQGRLLAYTNEQTFEGVFERLKPRLYTETTYIVHEGDPVNELLFITRGQLESLTTNGGSYSVLKEGDICGDELLTWTTDPKPGSNSPPSTRTVKALTEVEGFALLADDIKFIAIDQFRRIQIRQEQHIFRFYSQQWRTWAAVQIQITWHRFSKRKLLKEIPTHKT